MVVSKKSIIFVLLNNYNNKAMTKEQARIGAIIRSVNDILYVITSYNKDTTPAKVYVVTTIVEEGQEFENRNYCGVFKDKAKAEKYFNSEKRDWYEKLAERYCNDGESVTTYMYQENICRIYGDYDAKDSITISIEEKSVQ